MHSILLVFLGVRWSLSIILPEMLKGRTEKLLEVKYDGILICILQSRDCVCFGPLHQMMVSLCCFSPTSRFECLCLVLREGAEYTSLLQSLQQLSFLGKKIMVGLKFWGMGKNFMLNYGYWIGNFEIGLFFCSTQKQYPFIAVRNHGHVNKALLLLALRVIQINSSNKLTLSQNTYVSF